MDSMWSVLQIKNLVWYINHYKSNSVYNLNMEVIDIDFLYQKIQCTRCYMKKDI